MKPITPCAGLVGTAYRLKIPRIAVAVLFFVLGCNPPAKRLASNALEPSQAIELKSQKGPVSLSVRLSPRSPRLSDLVALELTVEAESGVELKAPAFGDAVGDFLVRDYGERTKTVPGDSTQPNRRVFHYQLEPVHTGIHLIRSVAIEFVDQRESADTRGQSAWIESEPIEVTITSELGEQLPDLADIEPMKEPLSLNDPMRWWWLAGLILLFTGFAVFWLRRRKSSVQIAVSKLSPEELAHTQLEQLLAENLPSQGKFKDFYLRLTGIVRYYIEGITSLRAPEQTTEEFLKAIRGDEVFTPVQAARLKEFLEAADMVKYAGQQPDSDQVGTSIQRAKEFIVINAVSVPTEAALTMQEGSRS